MVRKKGAEITISQFFIENLSMNKSEKRKRQQKNSTTDSDDDRLLSKGKQVRSNIYFFFFVEVYVDGYDDEYLGNVDG